MDNTQQSPLTTISVGPGIRGIERGIEHSGARLKHIAYVEIEAFIIENLVAEMEAGILDPAVIWSDCKTFPSELFRGKVNLLLAGYPCQPFSNAGARKGAGDPRHLWPHIERTIDIIRPDICFFENVRGHITLGLREVIESLEGLGYRVHWGIFSAEETGASHKRERVFIMAVRKDLLGYSDNQQINSSIGGIWGELNSASSEMGYSKGKHAQRSSDESEISRFQNRRSGSPELAYTNNSRSQQDSQSGQLRTERIEQSPGYSGRNNQREVEKRQERAVARPGQPQQTWEHPRVISRKIESDVGMSINGYHFREDFLRAVGNSVYPPTANLAWVTLCKKHGIIL